MMALSLAACGGSSTTTTTVTDTTTTVANPSAMTLTAGLDKGTGFTGDTGADTFNVTKTGHLNNTNVLDGAGGTDQLVIQDLGTVVSPD